MGAAFDVGSQTWRTDTSKSSLRSCYSILGTGGLSEPVVPTLPGIVDFRGERIHSARWNHAFDLRGKRVAVIGTDGSAIQFVPEIAASVASLSVFQRTPPWIVPRGDRPFTALCKSVNRWLPGVISSSNSGEGSALETQIMMAVFASLRAPHRSAYGPGGTPCRTAAVLRNCGIAPRDTRAAAARRFAPGYREWRCRREW